MSDFIPSWKYLQPVLPLGAGSFLTQLCIVATTVANNILLKSYGAQSVYGPDIPLSAFVVIIKLFQIILNIACGITAGALPIMGYNYGARLYSRVKETFKLVVLSTLTVCVIATVLFESVPLVFVRMFGTDGGELYTAFAISCLRIYLCGQICGQGSSALKEQAKMVIKNAACQPFARVFRGKNRSKTEGGRVRW